MFSGSPLSLCECLTRWLNIHPSSFFYYHSLVHEYLRSVLLCITKRSLTLIKHLVYLATHLPDCVNFYLFFILTFIKHLIYLATHSPAQLCEFLALFILP